MQKIEADQKYTREMWLYLVSKMCERASFYGIRSLVIIYVVESLGLSNGVAVSVYGWVISSLVFFNIVGALLGDLLIGNRNAILAGGLLQVIGAFILCIHSTAGLYTGLICLVVGSGLFSPNFLSNYGKLYATKQELMHGGFTAYFVAINLGAFIGLWLIGYLFDIYYCYGFIAAGVIMLVPVLLSAFRIKKETVEMHSIPKQSNNRIVIIILAIACIGFFWVMYDLGSEGQLLVERKFRYSSLNFPVYSSNLSGVLNIVIGLAASILWSHYRSRSLTKLVIAFFLGALAFGILLFIGTSPEGAALTGGSVLIFLLSALILSTAEILITPSLYTIITKHAHPKYLAIVLSLAFIPYQSVFYVHRIVLKIGEIDEMLCVQIASTGLTLVGIILLFMLIFKNKKSKQLSAN